MSGALENAVAYDAEPGARVSGALENAVACVAAWTATVTFVPNGAAVTFAA